MKQFTFKKTGNKIEAITNEGKVLATFTKVVSKSDRGYSARYDIHRHCKGDHFDYDEKYDGTGLQSEVLDAAQSQLPKSFIEAKWALRKLNENDDFAVFNFLEGLIKGEIAWYGNTNKKIITKVKRDQAKLVFQINEQ